VVKAIGLHGVRFAKKAKHGLASIVFGLTVMFAGVLRQGAICTVIMT
jgi:hypothetical protein